MAQQRLTLLIDADVLRYLMAFRNTSRTDWGDGEEITESINPEKAKTEVEGWIEEMLEKFGATDYLLALSCKKHNFRKDVFETYKSGRHAKSKPKLWYVLDEFMYETWADKIVEIPNLEGDDVLGLLATHPNPKRAPGKRIVISIDKDLQTIPCRLYNPNKPDIGVRTISRMDANLFWMKQTLTGDATDEYPGLKGIGLKRADEILMPVHEALLDATPEEHLKALWNTVVKTYEARDSTAEDALQQARCARILRNGDYTKKHGVKLWKP